MAISTNVTVRDEKDFFIPFPESGNLSIVFRLFRHLKVSRCFPLREMAICYLFYFRFKIQLIIVKIQMKQKSIHQNRNCLCLLICYVVLPNIHVTIVTYSNLRMCVHILNGTHVNTTAKRASAQLNIVQFQF